MQQFVIEKHGEIVEICRSHHVKSLSIFGSAVRDNFDPERSDVDILVEFEAMPIEDYARNKFDLEESLVRLFGRDVDLVVPKYVRNPYLKRSIEETKQDLYAA